MELESDLSYFLPLDTAQIVIVVVQHRNGLDAGTLQCGLSHATGFLDRHELAALFQPWIGKGKPRQHLRFFMNQTSASLVSQISPKCANHNFVARGWCKCNVALNDHMYGLRKGTEGAAFLSTLQFFQTLASGVFRRRSISTSELGVYNTMIQSSSTYHR